MSQKENDLVELLSAKSQSDGFARQLFLFSIAFYSSVVALAVVAIVAYLSIQGAIHKETGPAITEILWIGLVLIWLLCMIALLAYSWINYFMLRARIRKTLFKVTMLSRLDINETKYGKHQDFGIEL